MKLRRCIKKLELKETGQKQTENELRRIKERLDLSLTTAPVVVFTSKTSGDFSATYVVGSSRALLGYKPKHFTSDSGFWAENIHPEKRERTFKKLSHLFKHGRHIHECRFRHADGTY